MGTTTLISVGEYLRTSYSPDCDYVDGEVVERHVGRLQHSHTIGQSLFWFAHLPELRLEPYISIHMRVSETRYRVADVAVVRSPCLDEDFITTPPYVCLEILSPEDTVCGMQDRLDDYLRMGVENVWVIDPFKRLAWTVTAEGWQVAAEALRTRDGKVAMPLADVLPPE